MAHYDFNIRNVITGLLPASLRSNVVDLLAVFTSPIADLHRRFTVFRGGKLSDLSYNSQYPNLQRLLNDRYDEPDRRIRVYDRSQITPVVVYPDVAVLPLALPVWVYPERVYYYRGFIVQVPAEFENTDTINQIKKTVNTYKFAGIYYEIIYQ